MKNAFRFDNDFINNFLNENVYYVEKMSARKVHNESQDPRKKNRSPLRTLYLYIVRYFISYEVYL